MFLLAVNKSKIQSQAFCLLFYSFPFRNHHPNGYRLFDLKNENKSRRTADEKLGVTA
uniref:Uncharacterized protein n=1 Tax=Utricularia reniformis TaxID=192314 RepID=A0A1Y0B0I6_9LAMI|nr:hypothetical protein AEK19_MT0659 [Utricularia reniformis]ART30910.1 hypothetical protein AEK19_MT0659 [Utricularia reniformis]